MRPKGRSKGRKPPHIVTDTLLAVLAVGARGATPPDGPRSRWGAGCWVIEAVHQLFWVFPGLLAPSLRRQCFLPTAPLPEAASAKFDSGTIENRQRAALGRLSAFQTQLLLAAARLVVERGPWLGLKSQTRPPWRRIFEAVDCSARRGFNKKKKKKKKIASFNASSLGDCLDP